MSRILAKIALIFLISSLVFIPFGPAFAQTGFGNGEPDAEVMIGDLLVARPLGLVSLVVGSTFFLVSLPFSATGGNIGTASKKLVIEPAKFCFNRPLGEF